jgi:hypothetical protein
VGTADQRLQSRPTQPLHQLPSALLFPVVITDAKGKQRKTYPYEALMTPYDKFKSLPNAEQYLKPGITLKQLDDMATAISDNDAAKQLNEAKLKLYKTIFEQKHRAA